MKIVINAFSARLGGGRTYIINLLQRLPKKESFDVEIFCPKDLDLPPDPRITEITSSWPVHNPLVRTVWERFVLPRYLRESKADILFCPGGVVATGPPEGCQTVTMFRNMMPFDAEVYKSLPFSLQKIRNYILRHVMLRSMKSADLTIFISDFARSFIEKIAVIPNAITIPHGIAESFKNSHHDLVRPEAVRRKPYLLYVSRFEIYKHHYQVVQAFSLLPKEMQLQYDLLLVGEHNFDEGHRVRRLVTELDIETQVIFAGAVPYSDLPRYYQNAEAIIFASSCENCPNIMLEGMAAGRPMLASDIMPMPEFGGPAMEYFSPHKPSDIAEKLERVLSDSEYAKRLAVASKERSRLYDWDETASKTWKAIMNLANDQE